MMSSVVNRLVELVSDNSILSSLFVAVIAAASASIWRWRVNRRDKSSIHQFLRDSAQETSFTFRTTEAIAAATDLTEERVAAVCARDKAIQRNQREKQSWALR